MSVKAAFRLTSSPDIRPEGQDSVSPKRIYFLSVEGRHTERDYFRGLQHYAHDKQLDGSWEIAVLRPQRAGDSSPGQVLDLLENCRNLREDCATLRDLVAGIPEKYTHDRIRELLSKQGAASKKEIKEFRNDLMKLGIAYDALCYLKNAGDDSGAYDVFGVVLDRDKESHAQDALDEIKDACNRQGFRLYLSNPCFEFWLLLHLVDVSADFSDEDKAKCLENLVVSSAHTFVSKRVSEMAGHAKRIRYADFKDNYAMSFPMAIARAKTFAVDYSTLMSNIGSNVFKLVEELMQNGSSMP